jgi:hypothetical protein
MDVVVSIENFNPDDRKAQIGSPRTLQAASNLGIEIDDIYVANMQKIRKLMEEQGKLFYRDFF